MPRPTLAQLQAENERLRLQNAELAAKKTGVAPKLTHKVSQKGAVSTYGLGRWPVTLYESQARRFGTEAFGLTAEQFENSPMGKFIEANKANLKSKESAE